MAEAAAPGRTHAIIGFLIAGAAIIGASFFVSTRDPSSGDDVPPIAILGPADGDTLAEPVTLLFRTPARLELHPGMGWMAGDLHLHAMVGGRELMPAAADIAPSDSSWTWRLPVLGAGSHRLYLTWAGRHHGNLRGVTDTIRVHVRP
jgi:hypothetical protein